jgi:hypothetical protein
LGDWFPSKTYLLTSKASPNDTWIVIIVIIVVGEVIVVEHLGADYSTELRLAAGDFYIRLPKP